jgi:ABC-2 type transport system ATP-binding protein
MSVVELSDIHRCYRAGEYVLRGVSLSVEPGEVVALIGRNGAGKTTLLKIALGLLHAQRGTVKLFGLDPRTEAVEVKRRTGYVSTEQVFPPYLRVREVIEIHRSLFPTWDPALERELCSRFGLTGRERIEQLSTGQARRVGVLCAIAHRPELLLLDEPAGGLDPATRREFLAAALQLLADQGSAIVFSSHYMSDVERIASRVCLLHRGERVIDRGLDALREGTTLVILPGGHVTPADLRALEGCLSARVVSGGELRAVFEGDESSVRARLRRICPGQFPVCKQLALEELVIEMTTGRP